MLAVRIEFEVDETSRIPASQQAHNALLLWLASDIAWPCRSYGARTEWGPQGSHATTQTNVRVYVGTPQQIAAEVEDYEAAKAATIASRTEAGISDAS